MSRVELGPGMLDINGTVHELITANPEPVDWVGADGRHMRGLLVGYVVILGPDDAPR